VKLQREDRERGRRIREGYEKYATLLLLLHCWQRLDSEIVAVFCVLITFLLPVLFLLFLLSSFMYVDRNKLKVTQSTLCLKKRANFETI